MRYEEFKNEVVRTINEKYSNITTKIMEVYKTNGIVLDGLVVMENKLDMFPVIYLNDYYYEEMNLEECMRITESIIDDYQKMKEGEKVNIWSLSDFKVTQDNILVKIINTKRNMKLLQGIPSIQIHDLSMVFFVEFCSADGSRQAHILVHNELLNLWNIDLAKLQKIARENTIQKYASKLKNMNEIVADILGIPDDNKANSLDIIENIDEEEGEKNGDFDNSMFVLSNEINSFGAVLMTYDEVMKEMRKKIGKNFYILPSSVDELILVPENNDVDVERLRNMVCEVNKEVVSVEDYLSDSVYYYDGEDVREV